MMLDNIISPTPVSPKNIPNLCQEFESPFYTTKRPTNIIVNFKNSGVQFQKQTKETYLY